MTMDWVSMGCRRRGERVVGSSRLKYSARVEVGLSCEIFRRNGQLRCRDGVGGQLVYRLARLGEVIVEDDVGIAGIGVGDVGLLEDGLRLPGERNHANHFEYTADEWGRTRRGVEDVVTRVVDSEAYVDSDGSLGDMVDVELGLGGKGRALTISVLDETHSTEGEKGLGWVRVELWPLLVE
jgi:hypothetical protein